MVTPAAAAAAAAAAPTAAPNYTPISDPAPSSCETRWRRRRVARRLLPLVLATAAATTTLIVDAMAPPHHAFSRGGAAAGVAFQRPQLWHQTAAAPTSPYQPAHLHAAPIVASPSALLGSSSSPSSSEGEAEEEGAGGGKRAKRGWGGFTQGFLNKAQAVAASDDFKVLARGARTVLKELMEVDVGPMDVQTSIDRLQRGVDGVLSRTVMSIEGLLQMYAGRSSTADGVLGRVRRRIAKMVRNGLGSLMSEDAVGYSLYSVNMTALMVEEMASRRTADARKALGMASNPDEPLPLIVQGQIQRDVMREMVVVAEDAEAFAATVVESRWFRRSYCTDDEEAAQYANLLTTKLVSRLVLAVAAGVLHGYRPTEDPLLALLVVAYASGSLTRQVAANFLGLVGTALTAPQGGGAEGAGGGANGGGGGSGELATAPAAAVKAGDWVIDRLPDVWSAADSPEDIGEGLFRLFQALERRKAVSLAKQAGGSCPTEAPPPTYLASAALEAAAANPAASQLASLTGGGGGGGAAAADSGSIPWAARPGSQATAAAFLPPLIFRSTTQGSRLVLLAKSVGTVRRRWKTTTVAALGTMALLWLARWFVASPTTSSTVRFGNTEDEEEQRRMRDLDAAIGAGAVGSDGEG